jgi:hypothetical protein
MPRQILRYFLTTCLILSTAFALWTWFRPYAWGADAAARCQVVSTLVTRDQSYLWVDVHLKVTAGKTHDLEKSVLLEVANGAPLEPAETTFAGADPKTTNEIWFRFWLEEAQIKGPLTLRINDGKLAIKTTPGVPNLADGAYQNFTTSNW